MGSVDIRDPDLGRSSDLSSLFEKSRKKKNAPKWAIARFPLQNSFQKTNPFAHSSGQIAKIFPIFLPGSR
ncbi:hypothetical protein DLM78_13990 [Leptospira stimsonii]|uniref:Uncharacterized protein n=1 Tax=Leptospira stimsonii TaxID=2202203 RepID=A0A8B3CQE0_9LEPT|nr:hypothetical protein DLM78_13990 [Leptospira stimsonii]